ALKVRALAGAIKDPRVPARRRTTGIRPAPTGRTGRAIRLQPAHPVPRSTATPRCPGPGALRRLVQTLAVPGHHALREEELDLEGRGEHLGEERTADEWPAHTRDLVWSKGSEEAGDERMNGGRLDEQPREIEPDGRVVSRFEAEVAVPG